MPSGIDWVRELCMRLPHVTENVQWGNDLLFRIGGKMFAVTALEPSEVVLSFKCDPETFAELTEREGVIPAPYLARAQWVGLERWDAIPSAELRELLRRAYEIVRDRLPKKTREQLGAGPAASSAGRRKAAGAPAKKTSAKKTSAKKTTAKKSKTKKT